MRMSSAHGSAAMVGSGLLWTSRRSRARRRAQACVAAMLLRQPEQRQQPEQRRQQAEQALLGERDGAAVGSGGAAALLPRGLLWGWLALPCCAALAEWIMCVELVQVAAGAL